MTVRVSPVLAQAELSALLEAMVRLVSVGAVRSMMTLLLSVVVRTFAWIVILGREGVINQALLGLGLISEPLKLLQTELGLVISLTQIEMPLMLLPLISVMSRLDPNLRDASAALGASRWRTLFTVIVPLSMPGLVAGCLLVFIPAIVWYTSWAFWVMRGKLDVKHVESSDHAY